MSTNRDWPFNFGAKRAMKTFQCLVRNYNSFLSDIYAVETNHDDLARNLSSEFQKILKRMFFKIASK